MVDHSNLSDEVDRFAHLVVDDYALTDALHDLVHAVGAILDIDGAGVSLVQSERLVFVTAVPEAVAAVEGAQELSQTGPCVDAVATGGSVFVADLSLEPDRWPAVGAAAAAAGIRALAGVPMRVDDLVLGVLDLYDRGPHRWSEDEVVAAGRLAALATGYVVNAARVDDLRHTNERLQEALDGRVLIEQAKGILAAEREITVDEAFALLRSHARSNGASLRAVADAVVNLGLRPG